MEPSGALVSSEDLSSEMLRRAELNGGGLGVQR